VAEIEKLEVIHLLLSRLLEPPPPHHHNHFTALFPGPPRWAGARRELLDFMVRQDHPVGRQSIRTKQ